MVVLEIRSAVEFNNLLRTYDAIILDCYADWCQPCKILSPKFEQLASDYNNPRVVWAREDNDLGLHQCDGLPTIMYFIRGKKVDQTVGADFPDIVSKVQKVYSTLGFALPSQPQRTQQPPRPQSQPQPMQTQPQGPKNKISSGGYARYGDLGKPPVQDPYGASQNSYLPQKNSVRLTSQQNPNWGQPGPGAW